MPYRDRADALKNAKLEVASYVHGIRTQRVSSTRPYQPRIYPCAIHLTENCDVEEKLGDVINVQIIDAQTRKPQTNIDRWPTSLIPSGGAPYKYANPSRLKKNHGLRRKKINAVKEWLDSNKGCWLAGAYFRDRDRFHRNDPNQPRPTQEQGHVHAYSHEFDAVLQALSEENHSRRC